MKSASDVSESIKPSGSAGPRSNFISQASWVPGHAMLTVASLKCIGSASVLRPRAVSSPLRSLARRKPLLSRSLSLPSEFVIPSPVCHETVTGPRNRTPRSAGPRTAGTRSRYRLVRVSLGRSASFFDPRLLTPHRPRTSPRPTWANEDPCREEDCRRSPADRQGADLAAAGIRLQWRTGSCFSAKAHARGSARDSLIFGTPATLAHMHVEMSSATVVCALKRGESG